MWDGMAVVVKVIWVRRERKYFCKWGWTGTSRNSLSGKSTDAVRPDIVRARTVHPAPAV
jgi:hypothetical protein